MKSKLAFWLCTGLVMGVALSSPHVRREIRDFILNMIPGQSVVDGK